MGCSRRKRPQKPKKKNGWKAMMAKRRKQQRETVITKEMQKLWDELWA